MNRQIALSPLLAIALIGCGGSEQKENLTKFQILPEETGRYFANGVSGSGNVIVGGNLSTGSSLYWIGSNNPRTFSGFTANGISTDGSTALGLVGSHPATYDLVSNVATAVPLPPGFTEGTALAINANRSLILAQTSQTLGSRKVYVVSNGTPILMPNLNGAGDGQAAAMSDRGFVAVGVSDGRPVRWTNLSSPTVDPLVDASGNANDVSADGNVIVGRYSIGSAWIPFRWTAATGAVALPFPEGLHTGEATSVSADGNIVLGQASVYFNNQVVPFIWTAAGGTRIISDFVEFDGTPYGGLDRLNAFALSTDGRTIVGTGVTNGGFAAEKVWRLRLR